MNKEELINMLEEFGEQMYREGVEDGGRYHLLRNFFKSKAEDYLNDYNKKDLIAEFDDQLLTVVMEGGIGKEPWKFLNMRVGDRVKVLNQEGIIEEEISPGLFKVKSDKKFPKEYTMWNTDTALFFEEQMELINEAHT